LSDSAKQQFCVASHAAASSASASPAENAPTCFSVGSKVEIVDAPGLAHKPLADPLKGKSSVVRLAVSPLIKSERASDSAFTPVRVSFVDTCADASFLTRTYCAKNGISVCTHGGSTMHMSTVMGTNSQPHTTTEALHLLVGNGRGSSRLRFNCIVLDGDDSLAYDLIIGTPVLRAWAAEISFRYNTMTIYPSLFSRGELHSEGIVLDIIVCKEAEPSPPKYRAHAVMHSDTSPVSEDVYCCGIA